MKIPFLAPGLLACSTLISPMKAVPPPLEADQYYHRLLLEPTFHGTLEAVLCSGDNGRVYCVYEVPSEKHAIVRMASDDGGRTWTAAEPMVDGRGRPILGLHITLLRLKSGRWGLVYATRDVPEGRPGRDGGTVFRTSDDARTWSDPAVIERRFGICCSGHALVLKDGRIVVPIFKWVSADPTGGAEYFNASSLSYSYSYVSDDEGRSWTQGLSELFVSSYRAAYDLEEPTVVEMKDGRLLMHLRSQLGRMYRSYSSDGGISWTKPEAMPIAASYTPSLLKRIPGTGDLLLVWNQASRGEILLGLSRHRLSCAISQDEGRTWTHFKNLESLDDETVIRPPPADRIEVIEMWDNYGFFQPLGRPGYVRAPGVLRICYPSVAFRGDEALIAYDYGMGTLGDGTTAVKFRAVPVSWFYR